MSSQVTRFFIVILILSFTLMPYLGIDNPATHFIMAISAACYGVLLRREDKNKDPFMVLGLRKPKSSKGLWFSIVLGVILAFVRFFWIHDLFHASGVNFYAELLFKTLHLEQITSSLLLRSLLSVLILFPLFLAALIPGPFLCGIIQNRLKGQGHFLFGLILQSFVFGLIHCFTPASPNIVYGLEAFMGGIIYGVLFDRYDNNCYYPAIFLTVNVWVIMQFIIWLGL